MKDIPILFSAPMVRAILAGTKTLTRRVVKPQPTHFNPAGVPRRVVPSGGPSDVIACPYGQPGDRLWVRETFSPFERNDMLKRGAEIFYRADGDCLELKPWRPSIHMPRWASRILLEVVSVRVERLQSISRDDALAEGIVQLRDRGYGLPAGEHYHAADPRQSYLGLWEAINGPGSVEADPWTWAVEFKHLKGQQ